MHKCKERTKILVWFWIIALESCCFHRYYCLAAVGGGWSSTGRERRSSFFGILGNALSGRDGDSDRKYDNCSLSRSSSSSSYTRLGRLFLSRGSSSELSLEDWAKTKSSSNSNKIVLANNNYRDVVEVERSRSRRATTKEATSNSNNNNANNHSSIPSTNSRRCLDRNIKDEYDYNDDDEDDDTWLKASLSTTTAQQTDLTAMTLPIVPLSISFDGQTGEEFSDPATMDLLVASGLEMATQDNNDWIEWEMHSSTKKLLEENHNNEMAVLEQGEVMVYIGKAKQEGHGSNLPIIKTKSILPLAAEEMADLLLDSSKVKIYNKLSVGRTDVRILGEGTKVVCNLTKPPIAKSNMVSCTLMHSRRLEGTESSSDYIVVSRAVPGMMDDSMSDLPRNDILLGVNLLEDRGPYECIMTAVTHVYSPALPTILAKKLGVSSAINFVKDIRSSCKSVGS